MAQRSCAAHLARDRAIAICHDRRGHALVIFLLFLLVIILIVAAFMLLSRIQVLERRMAQLEFRYAHPSEAKPAVDRDAPTAATAEQPEAPEPRAARVTYAARTTTPPPTVEEPAPQDVATAEAGACQFVAQESFPRR